MIKYFNSIILDINPIVLVIFSIVAWLLLILNFIKKKKMKGVLNRLNNLLKEKEEKIEKLHEELNDCKNDLKDINKDIENLKKYHPELKNSNSEIVKDDIQNKQLDEETKVKELFFHKFRDGYFIQKDALQQFSKNIVYKISLNDNTEGSFTLVNENNTDYISNKDIFLNSDFCKVRYDSNGSRNRIGSIIPGRVHLDVDKWVVDKKVQIEIL